MRKVVYSIVAAFAIAGAAFSLEPPSVALLEGFIRERLTPASNWKFVIKCLVESDDEIIFEAIDSSATLSKTGAFEEFAFADDMFTLSGGEFFTPIRLARSSWDSLRINKTRTRHEGIMCWKARIFIGNEAFEVLLSSDGLFRVMKIERKGKGKSSSDDVWLFREVSRGKDIPIKMVRSVEFVWEGKPKTIVSTAVLSDLREFFGETDP